MASVIVSSATDTIQSDCSMALPRKFVVMTAYQEKTSATTMVGTRTRPVRRARRPPPSSSQDGSQRRGCPWRRTRAAIAAASSAVARSSAACASASVGARSATCFAVATRSCAARPPLVYVPVVYAT